MSSQRDSDSDDSWAAALRQGTKYLVRLERGIAVVMLVAIMCIMAAQVFARYVLNQPFSWSEELSRLALIWMSFISASFVMAEGNHIAVDLWSQRVSTKASRRLQLISYLAVAISCMMLFFGGLNFVVKVHPVGSATLGIPKSYWYASVSIGLLLMTLHAMINFVLLMCTGKPYVGEFTEPDAEPSEESIRHSQDHRELQNSESAV